MCRTRWYPTQVSNPADRMVSFMVPGSTVAKRKDPSPSAVKLRPGVESSLSIVTVAPATSAPSASITVPRMLPPDGWSATGCTGASDEWSEGVRTTMSCSAAICAGAVLGKSKGELPGCVRRDCACPSEPKTRPRRRTRLNSPALRRVYIMGFRSDPTSE